MNINLFKHNDWTKIYEGRWSFLSSTHFITQYTKEIKFGGQPFKTLSIILIAQGRSAGWMRQADRDKLGAYLSQQIIRNPKLVKAIAGELKAQAKSFLKFIAERENTVATKKLYDEFWRRLLAYYQPHINVKYVVDYLRPDLLKKYLPDLEAARLAAEPVLNRTEDFMISFAKLLSKPTKYDFTLLLCLTKEELHAYFIKGKLPKPAELKQRNKKSALLGDKKEFAVFTGSQVGKIELLVSVDKNTLSVKGASAFAGKAVGIARIILDPEAPNNFQTGDILISGSTRPEFLAIMHKAAAFVTDAGGILSHAAITAREMKKPCVIGTKNATKVFKDGDRIEVDANTGLIRKLN